MALPVIGRLPRGIPAASLKPVRIGQLALLDHGCLPRGIPAASLKLISSRLCGRFRITVFRGEYPRPH